MEKAYRIGERILDEHALSVAGDEIFDGRALVVGEQNGGLIVAEVGDVKLAVGALKRTRLLFVEAWVAVFAMGTSSSAVRQADAGRSATSASSLGERRRRVMKVIPAASSRSSP